MAVHASVYLSYKIQVTDVLREGSAGKIVVQ